MNEELEVPQPIPQVEEAFAEMFSMDSELSIEERLDKLVEAMTCSAFYLMDRQRRTGKKVSDAEREFQEEGMAQLKMIERCLSTAKKFGRLSGKVNPNFESGIVGRIRSMKGSVGDIVMSLPNKVENA